MTFFNTPLYLGLELYIFNGPLANRHEKAKAVEVAGHICSDERAGRAKLLLVDDEPRCPAFWNAVGGYVNVRL